MNLAWWPQSTDPRMASMRLRCFQIIDRLNAGGQAARVYAPGDPAPDVLVLSKRYDAATLAHALELRARAGTAIVLDLCDNHFFFEADPDGRLQQRADALRAAIPQVQLVITASPALAEIVAVQAPGARALMVIEDAVEPVQVRTGWARWKPSRANRALGTLQRRLRERGDIAPASRCVWFGNHGSPGVEGGMADLRRIRPDLEAATRTHGPLSLTVISNNEARFQELTAGWSVPVHYLPWDAGTFSEALALHGTALIPVNLNPFTVCKTANRVLTAFAHGLVVVGDSIPSYASFRDCAVLDDWETGLGPYRQDAARRQADVAEGRRRLAADFALDHLVQRWRTVLEAVHAADAPATAGAASA